MAASTEHEPTITSGSPIAYEAPDIVERLGVDAQLIIGSNRG